MAAPVRHLGGEFHKRLSKNQALPYQGEANGSPSGSVSTLSLSRQLRLFVSNPTDVRRPKMQDRNSPRRSPVSSTTSLVLLIEPNDDSRAVYAHALRHAGFTVVAAP